MSRRKVPSKGGHRGKAVDGPDIQESSESSATDSTESISGPQPKWLTSSNNHFGKSKVEENRIAKELGGRRLTRSGGMKWATKKDPRDRITERGDIQSDVLLIEHKRVELRGKSIGVTRKWLKDVTRGARAKMKIPAMVLTFEGAVDHEKDWMVLPMPLAKRLLQQLREQIDE